MSHHNRRQIGKYTLGREIGRGGFGVVYKGCHEDTQKTVAVKRVPINREGSEKCLLREIQIAVRLRHSGHQNVVPLIDELAADSEYMYFIMPFFAGGDLGANLKKNRALTEPRAQRFAIQIAAGLQHLHSLGIIHRDLKPGNILLSKGKEDATLCIADFGISRHQPRDDRMVSTVIGTFSYMAPEVLKGHDYDSKGIQLTQFHEKKSH